MIKPLNYVPDALLLLIALKVKEHQAAHAFG